jgi:hypothetical protein
MWSAPGRSFPPAGGERKWAIRAGHLAKIDRSHGASLTDVHRTPYRFHWLLYRRVERSSMDPDTVWDRGPHLGRFVRIILYAVVLMALLLGGLLFLEGGGSSPARPLGGQNVSTIRPAGVVPADGTTTTAGNNGNGNGGCKHMPNPPPNCKPSGS